MLCSTKTSSAALQAAPFNFVPELLTAFKTLMQMAPSEVPVTVLLSRGRDSLQKHLEVPSAVEQDAQSYVS